MYESNLFSDSSASESAEIDKTAEELAAERAASVAERTNAATAEQRQSQLFSG